MRDERLVILKTGEALAPAQAKFGDFENWFAKGLGLSHECLDVVSVYKGDPIPEAASVSAVVVTGSPSMVTDRADWSEASATWLRDIIERDAAPVLGVCYGHQLVAHALGGVVAPNPNGREMGTCTVDFVTEPSPFFRDGSFPAHFSHVESVTRVPTGARVLASTELDPHAAIQVGDRQWGVQFHPEFDVPIMRTYVETRRENLISEGLDPEAMIAGARETPDMANLLRRFVEIAGFEGEAGATR